MGKEPFSLKTGTPAPALPGAQRSKKGTANGMIRAAHRRKPLTAQGSDRWIDRINLISLDKQGHPDL